MTELFCCQAIRPYRPQRLDHEGKFDRFMQWAKCASSEPGDNFMLNSNLDYAVQLVKQVNFGPQESIRYFTLAKDYSNFIEITENDLLEANFEKLNSYKNFKCDAHNRFFEVNLYQKNPINRHHWRANLARPSTDIDLSLRQKAEEKRPDVGAKSSTSLLQSASDATGSNFHNATLQADKGSSKLESTAVKSALRFLLPTIRTNLGPNPLASLFCLDWVNKELGLGFDIDKDWESQLTTRNIATFIFDYSRPSAANSNTLDEIEISVDPVLYRNYRINNSQLPSGRKQFQEIVNQALLIKATSIWAIESREGIERTFTDGPNEQLLELFQHKDKEEKISSPTAKFKFTAKDESDDDDFLHDDDTGSYVDRYEDYYDHDFGSYSSDQDTKDFAACDKECGYCGRCSY